MHEEQQATRVLLQTTFAGQAEVLDRLGGGGNAEVWRLRDLLLHRRMVVKFPRRDLDDRDWVRRFDNEMRVQSRLEHPGIPPVYGSGQLADQRPYYTMRELSDSPMSARITGPPRDEDERGERVGWLSRAAQAVGYAHERGVSHRDIKPENLVIDQMAGVQVIDWGLAGLTGSAPEGVGERTRGRPKETRVAAGSWEIMAPEQLTGGLKAAGPAADVFALGVTLAFALTGRYVFDAVTVQERLDAIEAGLPELVGPPRLLDIARTATRARPEDRYPDALALHEALEDWLDQERRRREAADLLERADALIARASVHLDEGARLRAAANDALIRLPVAAPEEDKLGPWRQEDAADDAEETAAALEDQAIALLISANERAEDATAARERLADIYVRRAATAEARRVRLGLQSSLRLVRRFGGPRHRRWLAGDGLLTLLSDPPGAEVHIERFETRDRRLVPEPYQGGTLGQTPIIERTLARGSYLITLNAPGRAPVRYPVALEREDRWHGRPPGAEEPQPIWLPPTGWLTEDEIYVPAGWFRFGDLTAHQAFLPGRAWIPAFVIGRDPVSVQEYLDWLNALWRGGEEAEALARQPRDNEGAAVFTRGEDGFSLGPDGDGDLWQPDWPVTCVSWEDIHAYGAWRGSQDGRPWRLPRELEWEKAARGVDERSFPWGEQPEKSWANVSGSRTGRGQHPLASPADFPRATSVYGARGMAGHIFQVCQDYSTRIPTVDAEGRLLDSQPSAANQRRVMRGGHWNRDLQWAAAACRQVFGPVSKKDTTLGGRLVYGLDER